MQYNHLTDARRKFFRSLPSRRAVPSQVDTGGQKLATLFDDLNVVELGAGSVATSIAGAILADAGARVLKVEPPEGDRLRVTNPNGFLVWNRGKESVVADLRTEPGREALLDMASATDVVLEGFAPGRAESWRVGRGRMREIQPGLIHCSFSAFGRAGPYAGVKGYDNLVAAKSGLWARGAFAHRDGPLVYPVPWASFGAAMQAVAGIAAALLVRDRCGRGQDLDATLFAGLDPIDYFVATIAQLMAKRGDRPTTDARTATSASRYGVLVASRDSRFIQTSTLLPHQGRALCQVAGIAKILDDPRFARLPMFDSAEDAQDWEDLLVEAFRSEDLAHWLPLLEASPDVAFEVGRTSEEGLDHPQIAHNGDVVTIEDPVVGPVRQVGPIGHFSCTPTLPRRSAPRLGDNGGPFAPRVKQTVRDLVVDHPLSGITIVEFGYFYAMPYALAMAASLGARVIKIEDAAGDPHRRSFGPEVASNKTTAAKESVSLDLKSEAGQRIARDIVARADVFVTGFRSGVAERLGLGADVLQAANPKLLYVHAAGYGSTGPYAHRALYAGAAQAIAGSFGRQVGYWSEPSRSIDMTALELQAVVLPRLSQVVDGDSNAALSLFAAVCLGIYHQQRSGQGQYLETSMIAGNAWAYSDDFCAYTGKPAIPVCDDDNFGTSALDRVYRAADDTWVCLVVTTDREYQALAETLEDAGLLDDSYATSEGRKVHDSVLALALVRLFSQRRASEWEKRLTDAGVGCVEVNMEGQPVFTSFDQGLRDAGLTVTVDHPLFGEVVRAAPPIRFSLTPGHIAPPCLRGEHNRTVLAELGYSATDITQLELDRVVAAPDR